MGQVDFSEFRSRDYFRFAVPSLLGLFIFLFPVIRDGEMNIPLGIIIDGIRSLIDGFGSSLILATVLLSALGSLYALLFKPDFMSQNSLLKTLFVCTPFRLGVKISAALIVLALHFELSALPALVNEDTGYLMLDLGITLFATFLIVVFALPLLSDFGLMDFTGNLFRKFIHPLFRLPGRSAVDLVSSWVGGNAAGILVTIRQYESGFYSAREAITIATMFSVVSLPFCLVIAQTLGLGHLFMPLYLILIVIGILSTALMVRIPPLSRYEDSYRGKKHSSSEDVPPGTGSLRWGLYCALRNARSAGTAGKILLDGLKGTLDLILNVIPAVLTIGTAGLILAEYTPLFTWISYPFAYYLQVLSVEEAFQAAPTMVVGFTDMFLPAIIGSSLESLETRFIIALVSLVQIIYLSEMAAVLLASTIPVKLKDLILIFLVKTVIAIPLAVLFTRLLSIMGLGF